jgi:hypothetical protein
MGDMGDFWRDVKAQKRAVAKLERKLAYSAARSDVECFCIGDPKHGYSVPDTLDPEDAVAVQEAITYLELRGLLTRSRSGRVKVKDET